MDVLLVYSGCSKSQISLEFHSISRDDGACRVFFFFFFFSTFGPVAGCDVFTHSLSVDPRKQI